MNYSAEMDILKRLAQGEKVIKNNRDFLINHINFTQEIKEMLVHRTLQIDENKTITPTELGTQLYNEYAEDMATVQKEYSGIMRLMAEKTINDRETTKRPMYLKRQLAYQTQMISDMKRELDSESSSFIRGPIEGRMQERMDAVFNQLLTNRDKQILTQLMYAKHVEFVVKERDTESASSPWKNKTASRTKGEKEISSIFEQSVKSMEDHNISPDKIINIYNMDQSATQSVKALEAVGLIHVQTIDSKESDKDIFTLVNTNQMTLTQNGELIAEMISARIPFQEKNKVQNLEI